MLAAVALARGERTLVRRAHLVPALWLGVYAVCISYGYLFIGAAPGTVVFYCAVLVTLIGYDRSTGVAVAAAAAGRRGGGARRGRPPGGGGRRHRDGARRRAARDDRDQLGLYTAAGRGVADPRTATTGAFVLVTAVAIVPAVAGIAAGLHVTAEGVIWTAAMGAVPTALAYIAWYACQRSMSATTAGTVEARPSREGPGHALVRVVVGLD